MLGKVNKLKKFLVVSVCALLCVVSVGTADTYAFTRNCPKAPRGSKMHKWYTPDDQHGTATCWKNGYRTDVCAYCGQTKRMFDRKTNKHFFEDSPYKILKKNTCTKAGKIKVYCHNYRKGCRAYRIEKLAALGHTCTSYNHKTFWSTCTRCGERYRLTAKQRKIVDAELGRFGDGSFSSK